MEDLEIFPFIKDFTEEEKEKFSSFLQPMSAKKGTIIHYQGDICSNSLLVTKGTVRLYSQPTDFAEELTLYTLNAGEQCLSQITSEVKEIPTIPSAVAETDVEGYLVNKEEMEAFISSIPAYQNYIITLYAKKVAELTTTIQQVKFKNLDERIMDFLRKNEKKTISITHSDLANKLNTSRSVISRVLKKLEEKKMLSLHRGYIELHY